MWWFVLGGITWAVSVGIKIVLAGLFDLSYKERLSAKAYAAWQGLLSAVTELGAAALVFIYVLSTGSLASVVAFGAGAGVLEALILLGLAFVSKEKSEDKETLPWYQRWTFVIERFGALLGHIGSRGLVWLSVHGSIYPLVLAVIAFASIDGVATYGTFKKWDWLELKTWKRFYGFVIVVGMVEVMLFLGLYFQ